MNNEKIYILTNFIIYSLIIVLILIISYNILILSKKYTTPQNPKNSINVSPNYSDPISDVLLDN